MNRASVALSWDGARVPAGKLPSKARAFLGPITPAKKLAALLSKPEEIELRICWVPRLRGGVDVLVPSFETAHGKRLKFQMTRAVLFGPILGAIYRR